MRRHDRPVILLDLFPPQRQIGDEGYTCSLFFQPYNFPSDLIYDSFVFNLFSFSHFSRKDIKNFPTVFLGEFFMSFELQFFFLEYLRKLYPLIISFYLYPDVFILNLNRKIYIIKSIPFIRSGINLYLEILLQLSINRFNFGLITLIRSIQNKIINICNAFFFSNSLYFGPNNFRYVVIKFFPYPF